MVLNNLRSAHVLVGLLEDGARPPLWIALVDNFTNDLLQLPGVVFVPRIED